MTENRLNFICKNLQFQTIKRIRQIREEIVIAKATYTQQHKFDQTFLSTLTQQTKAILAESW